MTDVRSKLVFIPGNQDAALREYVDTRFGEIRLVEALIHTAADGRRYLPIHGDKFDQITNYHRWIAVLGDHACGVLVHSKSLVAWFRRRLGVNRYWFLCGYAKRRVKTAGSCMCDFAESVVHCVKNRGVDGVICGHIHAAAIKEVGGIRYLNYVDWVDSCTAIVGLSAPPHPRSGSPRGERRRGYNGMVP